MLVPWGRWEPVKAALQLLQRFGGLNPETTTRRPQRREQPDSHHECRHADKHHDTATTGELTTRAEFRKGREGEPYRDTDPQLAQYARKDALE